MFSELYIHQPDENTSPRLYLPVSLSHIFQFCTDFFPTVAKPSTGALGALVWWRGCRNGTLRRNRSILHQTATKPNSSEIKTRLNGPIPLPGPSSRDPEGAFLVGSWICRIQGQQRRNRLREPKIKAGPKVPEQTYPLFFIYLLFFCDLGRVVRWGLVCF